MRTKPEPKGAFKKETKTVVDAQRSIRDDSEIDESTKEQIVRFMSYLAVDNGAEHVLNRGTPVRGTRARWLIGNEDFPEIHHGRLHGAAARHRAQ